jgi:hypothetical protein
MNVGKYKSRIFGLGSSSVLLGEDDKMLKATTLNIIRSILNVHIDRYCLPELPAALSKKKLKN